MYIELMVTFLLSFMYLFLLRKTAKHYGLVDRPNERKEKKKSLLGRFLKSKQNLGFIRDCRK